MRKKSLLMALTLFIFLLSSCGMYDEIKSISQYSDFLFAFQKYWKTNLANLTPITGQGSGETAGRLYVINIAENAPIVSVLNNQYFGTVKIGYLTVTEEGKEAKKYFRFEANLSVKSSAKTIVGIITDMEIKATCVDAGLILDGYSKVQNNSSKIITLYTQIANLEGLWILLDDPAAGK